MKGIALRQTVSIYSAMLLLVSGFLYTANGTDLEQVQRAIQEKGAKWTAGETRISKLPPEQMKLRLGTIIPDQEHKGNIPPAQGLPIAFDWRDNGGNWVTSVKDQDGCGSCWAFGSVAALESLALIAAGTPDPPGPDDIVDLSEQFLVSCNRLNNGCGGGAMAVAYNFLRRVGTPDEECFPYQAMDLECELRCSDWRDRRVQISRWSWVPRNVNALKAAVYENPVSTGFFVYEDFFYYTGGVYEYVEGSIMGGHAVVIVGWDDEPPEGIPCFIVKNSWDTDWGEDGYFRIGYSQLRNKVRFGSGTGNFDMREAKAAPPITDSSQTVTTLWGRIKDNAE